MRIGSCDTSEQIALIAEVGNNHEGSLNSAIEHIECAFENGADAVKLQTYVPELFVSTEQTDRLAMLRRFCLPMDSVEALIDEYKSRGRTLFSTPLDLVSLGALRRADLLKVSSGDISFDQLIQACAEMDKDLILSTGASTEIEVRRAVTLVENVWTGLGHRRDLAVLHCVSTYPMPRQDANLRCIASMGRWFPNLTVGFSDHSIGIDVALLAASAGARIVEKHFTLDKNSSSFRDHVLSADPTELRTLRQRLDDVNEVLGDGVKRPQPSEAATVMQIRRSVTALRSLEKGERIAPEDVGVLRPGGGLEPHELAGVLGKLVARNIPEGAALHHQDLA